MKAVYLVTEDSIDAEILKRVLPKEVMQNTEIVVARGAYAARSLAGTILSERMRPVALVVDADIASGQSDEQAQTIKSLILPASSGIPFDVFVAVPNLEEMLTRASAQTFSQPIFLEQLDQVSSEQIQLWQRHPLIQRLLQFLASTLHQAA